MESEEYKSANDIEWEQRTLCSDEGCIGVIGPDGRCKECGLPYEGDLQQDGWKKPAAVEPEAEVVSGYGEDDENDPDDAVTDSEWERRTLCSDESCIGVIGPDGRCKECGLPYEQ